MKEDRGFEVFVVTEFVGHLLDRLNCRVQPLADSIGDA